MTDHSQWPPALRAALESPTLERRGWQAAIAPQLIGLFLWIVFFDQIPQETASLGGVGWPVLGAGLGGLLCYLLLYRAPASWGLKTRRPLGVLATSTFGVRGATWTPGVVLAVVAVVWLSVSTFYAVALTLRGLVLIQLLDPKRLAALNAGRAGTPGLLFLVTSLLWCYAAALVGRYLVRVIAALMNVFPILPAVLLGTTTILALKGLRGYHAAEAMTRGAGVGSSPEVRALLTTTQMVFAFFAPTALSCADWGTVARDDKDVRMGGWVGVVLAPWIVVTLAVLTTAGASAEPGRRGPIDAAADMAGPIRYATAVETLVGGRAAGAMLLVFGLAALAPAVYAGFAVSVRLNESWPRVSKTRWTILGAGLAWLLASTGLVDRLFDVFSVVGGLTAPAVGAVAADYARSRGNWPGARRGVNPPGLIAWSAGSILGLAPTIARTMGVRGLAHLQPAAVLGFLLAFFTYLVLAALGAESAHVALPEPELQPES